LTRPKENEVTGKKIIWLSGCSMGGVYSHSTRFGGAEYYVVEAIHMWWTILELRRAKLQNWMIH
jgi:hypothetical protein